MCLGLLETIESSSSPRDDFVIGMPSHKVYRPLEGSGEYVEYRAKRMVLEVYNEVGTTEECEDTEKSARVQ
jgi:hypothetical protein